MGKTMPSLEDGSAGRPTYNPMAALSLVPLSEAAKNLISRGAPHVFPLDVLAVFLPIFFVLAALTAGSAVPSGLLLPQIICGALVGRIMSLLLIELQVATGSFVFGRTHELTQLSSVWAP